jgi:hypothetical protein
MEDHNDLLTSLALSLYLQSKMEIFKEDNEKIESKGVLFKDFVRQHLKKENELENEIKQLKSRIKSTSTPMYNRMYELFVQMRNYIHISVDSDGYKLSIDNFPMSNDDADFIERQIMSADFNTHNKLELGSLKDAGIYYVDSNNNKIYDKNKLFSSPQNYGYFSVNDPTKLTSIFDY